MNIFSSIHTHQNRCTSSVWDPARMFPSRTFTWESHKLANSVPKRGSVRASEIQLTCTQLPALRLSCVSGLFEGRSHTKRERNYVSHGPQSNRLFYNKVRKLSCLVSCHFLGLYITSLIYFMSVVIIHFRQAIKR